MHVAFVTRFRGVERPVGGVRIRRVSRGKDFFVDIFSVLFRRPSLSLPVSHSSVPSSLLLLPLALSLSLFHRFALSPPRYGVSVFVRTYVSCAKCIVDSMYAYAWIRIKGW